jgi:hypothetical protein
MLLMGSITLVMHDLEVSKCNLVNDKNRISTYRNKMIQKCHYMLILPFIKYNHKIIVFYKR